MPGDRTERAGTVRTAALSVLKRAGASIECRVEGRSMEPTLTPGDRIKVQLGAETPLAPGDVVAFEAAGAITVHRVVTIGRFGRAASYVLTRGDAFVLLDHPVPIRAVIGVAREQVLEGESCEPIGRDPAGGGRRLVRQAMALPVVLAFHVDPGFAFVLTASAHYVRHGVARLLSSIHLS